MQIVILGSGTSTGVPVIGCHCQVCSSGDPRNRRTRSSALIRTDGRNILIDTSTDLRLQSLANGVERIDAVLFTHPHADHIHGIDDLRTFNAIQNSAIPCFGNEYTIKRIRRAFEYIFNGDGADGWKPNLTATVVDSPFEIFGVEVVPVEISHGPATILGWRIGQAAYVTDCNCIPAASLERLMGVEVLIVGALRFKPHPTHFNIEQAIEAAVAVKAARTVFTHLGHNLDYGRDKDALPPGMEFAYDGMRIEL